MMRYPALLLYFAPACALAGLTLQGWTPVPDAGLQFEYNAPDGESGGVSAVLAVPPGFTGAPVQLEVHEETPIAAGRTKSTTEFSTPVLGTAYRFRDLNLAALKWDPMRVRDGKTFRIRRATLRVQFRTLGGAGANAFAGTRGSPTEKILASWVSNYEQSRQFRMGNSTLARAAASVFLPPELPPIHLTVFTQREGISVLTYEALRAAGVPGGIDPRTFRLFRGMAEAPIFAHGEEDGRFNPGDYIEFIGARAEGTQTYLSPFTRDAVFYLAWNTGRPGLRAPAVPAPPRNAPLAPPYRALRHIEEDKAILRIGSTVPEDIPDLGSQIASAEPGDFWMWQRMGVERDAVNIPFDLPATPAGNSGLSAPGQNPILRISLKGITNDVKADPDHHLRFLLNNTDISLVNGVTREAIWEGQNSHLWESPPLPAGVLRPGPNTLTMVRVNDLRNSDGNPVANQDAYLNFLEVSFPAGYQAVEDRISFANDYPDSLGKWRFRLEGFTSPALSIWDTRGRKITGFSVARNTGTTVEFEDSLLAPVRYLAETLAAREQPGLRLDTLPDLSAPSEGADLLIITHRALNGGSLDSLVLHRRSQGLRVKVVDVQHIYQAFGNGATDPAAIRRFTQWAYAYWPRPAPTYLLLLGETSTWYDKQGGSLQQNLVPTHLVGIPGWGVAAADDFFGQVSGDDAVADMLVGRIPVADRPALARVVNKILRLERRPPGAWHNKVELVGGYEQSFTTGQYRLQSLAAEKNRPPERTDLFPASPYFRTPSQRSGFYRRLDSGFAYLGFFGHGGGSVWSDAGILTLDALDQDSLRGDYPVSLVSSITCLTGYFEDVAARSLGEELLRRPRNGAAGFYGASGYISNAAGTLLAAEMFQSANDPAPLTLGAVAHRAEIQVLLKTGNAFLPVLSEFNLLGDPSMPFGFAPSGGGLALTPKTLGGATQLDVSAATGTLQTGDGILTVLVGDSTALSRQIRISGGRIQESLTLSAALPPYQRGKVVVHGWDVTHSLVFAGDFSGLDWMIDSLRLDPPNPQPGDSVRVLFNLRDNRQVELAGGILLYSITGDIPGNFPPGNQIPVVTVGPNRFSTLRSFAAPYPSDADAPGLLQMNISMRLDLKAPDSLGGASYPTVDSRIFSLPLQPLARLSLKSPAFRLPIQDTLGVWVHFRNDGLGLNGPARLKAVSNPPIAMVWSDSANVKTGMKLGEPDSIFFRLPDSSLHLPLQASLSANHPAEVHPRGAIRDTQFNQWTSLLTTTGDSLGPWNGGPVLRLGAGSAARRAFLSPQPPPLLPAHLTFADTSTAARSAYRITTREPWQGALSISASGNPGSWHFAEQLAGPWLKLDTTQAAGPAGFFRPGFYGWFQNSDRNPPRITLQSRGQSLLPDDYIPRGASLQVLLEDPSGIDLAFRKPRIIPGASGLDSTSEVIEANDAFPTLARLQFRPLAAGRDSVTVEAWDAAGNRARTTFAFRVGTKLSIRNLGGYPNPFADTTVFAYALTDYCEEVILRVYARSGRAVRTLRDRQAVGYREVVWDGRTDDGRPIANGLYFLKATAKGGGRTTEATFKLFKKKY